MTKQVADSTASDRGAPRTVSAWEVWATLIDTSARLFIPSVGGTVAGLWLDLRLDTKPWFTISGVVLGTILAFSLVYLQIKLINKDTAR
ncbi:MAG TPA: AtpZ/AtpI family protein [Candidatus Limnocylindrales bacterium]|nr:AtpZ/AtpI family protein [Candidatus Limnocylindrales bacterium]